MKNTQVVVGMQWGDEGKGKITNFLSQQYDLNVRYQGGNNAGHTIVFDGQKYALQHIPSGIFNPKCKNILAQGMVINPKMILEELDNLHKRGVKKYQLFISNRAHVILPYHLELDGAFEELKGPQNKIGTTKKGIGPCYEDKYARIGIRYSDFVNPKLFKEKLEETLKIKNPVLKAFNRNTFSVDQIFNEYSIYAKKLKKFVVDTGNLIWNSHKRNESILFEGAQGIMLCIENGTYPYVTSSSPTASSIPLMTGTSPEIIQDVLGIVKAYSTRVGEGAFPTEILDKKLATEIRNRGNEYGTVTGRPRRIGWIDTFALNYAKRVGGITEIGITLLDVLDNQDKIKIGHKYIIGSKEIDYMPSTIEELKKVRVKYLEIAGWKSDTTKCKSWKDLPTNAKMYIKKIEELTKTKVKMVSVGPDRKQTIII